MLTRAELYDLLDYTATKNAIGPILDESMADIVFQGVTKIYDNGVRALNNLDLSVHDGELLVLVGPSGCGKTTTLRLIAGLDEADRRRHRDRRTIP